MAPDLGLVAHAAERHAHELAVGRLGHRLAERGLAHARRAHQAKDRRLHLVDAALHREVLDDALLDLLQAVVIPVQYFLRGLDVTRYLGFLLPGQVDQRLDVVAHHRRLGRHRRHELELLHLRVDFLARLLRHVRLADALLHLLQVGAFFALAELLLDGLDLLVEIVLALALLHLPLDPSADALFHLQDVDLGLELRHQVLEAQLDVEHLQHLLLLLQLERQMRGHGVGQAAGLVDALQRGENLGRDLLVQLHVLIEGRQQRAAHRLDLRVAGAFLLDRRRLGHPVGFHVRDAADVGAVAAFDQHLYGAVRQLEHLQDARHAADAVHVVGAGVVLGGRFLRDQQDRLARLHRRFHRLDRLGAPDEQRNHHVREHHHVAQRKQRVLGVAGEHFRCVGHVRPLLRRGRPCYMRPSCAKSMGKDNG